MSRMIGDDRDEHPSHRDDNLCRLGHRDGYPNASHTSLSGAIGVVGPQPFWPRPMVTSTWHLVLSALTLAGCLAGPCAQHLLWWVAQFSTKEGTSHMGRTWLSLLQMATSHLDWVGYWPVMDGEPLHGELAGLKSKRRRRHIKKQKGTQPRV